MQINFSELKKGSTFTIQQTHPIYNNIETTTYTVTKRTCGGNIKVTSEHGWGCTLKPAYFEHSFVEVLAVTH